MFFRARAHVSKSECLSTNTKKQGGGNGHILIGSLYL